MIGNAVLYKNGALATIGSIYANINTFNLNF